MIRKVFDLDTRTKNPVKDSKIYLLSRQQLVKLIQTETTSTIVDPSRAQCYKTFYDCNLQIFAIGGWGFPLKAFPAK
jgi:hypothetical protein